MKSPTMSSLKLLFATLLTSTLAASQYVDDFTGELARAINEANAHPGKQVNVVWEGGPYTRAVNSRLPAIREGANLSIVANCDIRQRGDNPCVVEGNRVDPIFHADKSARHCQLLVVGITFQYATVFYDLPCAVSMGDGAIENVNGPAVYLPRSLASSSFFSVSFGYCSHAAHGGAVVLGTRSGYLGNHRFENCYFYNNYAGMGGGAVYAAGQGTLRMTDCEISFNSAMYRGGGVFLAGPSFLSVRNTIANNTAMFGPGGGIFSIGQPVNPPHPPVHTMIKLCGDSNKLWSNRAPHVPGAASMGLAWNGTGAVQLCRMKVKEGSFPRWKGWEIREGCEGCPRGSAPNFSGY